MQRSIPNVNVNGDLVERLPGNASISFSGVDGSELLFKLDELGICASAGSACSTSNPEPSHVLTASGLEKEYINGTLRVSFGKDNTKEDAQYLVESLKSIINSKNGVT